MGPANVVKVTLTDWIRDQPGEAPPAMEQLASRDSEAELAAAIEASKLSAPDPYWDALGVEDRERCWHSQQIAGLESSAAIIKGR